MFGFFLIMYLAMEFTPSTISASLLILLEIVPENEQRREKRAYAIGVALQIT